MALIMGKKVLYFIFILVLLLTVIRVMVTVSELNGNYHDWQLIDRFYKSSNNVSSRSNATEVIGSNRKRSQIEKHDIVSDFTLPLNTTQSSVLSITLSTFNSVIQSTNQPSNTRSVTPTALSILNSTSYSVIQVNTTQSNASNTLFTVKSTYPSNSHSLVHSIIPQSTIQNLTLKTRTQAKPCRDIFEIHSVKNPGLDRTVGELVDAVNMMKSNHRFLQEKPYWILGDILEKQVTNSGLVHRIHGTNFTISKDPLIIALNGTIPFLPCQTKIYDFIDIQSCVKNRIKGGRTTNIAYLGDSHIRNQMEVLLDMLRPFNISIETSEKDFITVDDFLGYKGGSNWKKYKKNLNISSIDLPGFHIRFFWAPYLHEPDEKTKKESKNAKKKRKFSKFKKKTAPWNSIYSDYGGALEELNRILMLPSDLFPDIILLGTGTWELHSVQSIWKNIDTFVVHGMEKLFSVLDKLSKRATVAIMLPEPFQENIYVTYSALFNFYTLQHNDNLEWYRSGQSTLLPKNVLVWDSFLPFAYEAMFKCLDTYVENIDLSDLPDNSRFLSYEYYACGDRIHPGFRAIINSVQLLLNQLCNPYLDGQETEYCCQHSL